MRNDRLECIFHVRIFERKTQLLRFSWKHPLPFQNLHSIWCVSATIYKYIYICLCGVCVCVFGNLNLLHLRICSDRFYYLRGIWNLKVVSAPCKTHSTTIYTFTPSKLSTLSPLCPNNSCKFTCKLNNQFYPYRNYYSCSNYY